MADIKISQLGAAIAVGDTDVLPIVSGGNTLKATAAQVKEHSVGNTNISGIGDGSVTGAISSLNSGKQPKTLDTPLTIGGVSKTTVEAALGGLVSENQTLTQALANVEDNLSATNLGYFSTIDELGTSIATELASVTNGTVLNCQFGVNLTHDSIFEWLDYTGYIVRLYATQFIGFFENSNGNYIMIGTNDGGTTWNFTGSTNKYLASISQKKANNCTETNGIKNGTYFYLDGVLVRAINSISQNEVFTLNTNYEVVSTGALNELSDYKIWTISTQLTTTNSQWINITANKNGKIAMRFHNGFGAIQNLTRNTAETGYSSAPYSSTPTKVEVPCLVGDSISYYGDNIVSMYYYV